MTTDTTTCAGDKGPGTRQAIDTAAKRLRDEAEITLANVGESRLAHDIMTVLDALDAVTRGIGDVRMELVSIRSIASACATGKEPLAHVQPSLELIAEHAQLALDMLAATPPVPSGEGEA